MYRIGEFSKLAKVSVKTLRHYGKMGLLRPEHINGFNRYKYYSREQLDILSEILLYKDAGLSLDEIRTILGGGNRRLMLSRHTDCLREEVARIEHMVRASEELMKMANKYEPVMKEIPEHTVYFRKGIIETYPDVGRFVLETGKECADANPGLECLDDDYCYISYLDKEYKEKDIAIEYAQAVKGIGVETANVKFRKDPAITAICVMHKGAYSGLRNAYSAVLAYVQKEGYTIDENIREQYIDGCWNKDDEDDYLTEIQIPVKRK